MLKTFINMIKIIIIRIVNIIIIKIGDSSKLYTDDFFCHKIDYSNIVIRDDYIVSQCINKRILHIGFLDSPITADKISLKKLLHTRILEVAKSVFGIDIDDHSLSIYRKYTDDTNNQILDIFSSSSDISSFENKFDLILLPEVLEHLESPLYALKRLGQLLHINPGAALIITVPNAFSAEHFAAALNGVELVHPDHYFYFSPTTIKKLASDAGFQTVSTLLYSHTGKNTKCSGITSNGIIANCTLN